MAQGDISLPYFNSIKVLFALKFEIQNHLVQDPLAGYQILIFEGKTIGPLFFHDCGMWLFFVTSDAIL